MRASDFKIERPDNIVLYGRRWEPESAPKAAIALVHGIGEHTGRYRFMAETLTDAGFAIVGIDLRGHGLSGGIRGHAKSYDVLLDDVGELISYTSKQFPDIPLFLLGHSTGGALALNFAIRRADSINSGVADDGSCKIAGVIALSPFLRTAKPSPPWKLALANALAHIHPSILIHNGLRAEDLSRDPDIVKAVHNDPLYHYNVSVYLGPELIKRGEWAIPHAGELTIPLLIMHAGADRLTSPEASREFASKVKGDVTLKIRDGLYHELHNEPEKEEVFEEIVGWVNNHVYFISHQANYTKSCRKIYT